MRGGGWGARSDWELWALSLITDEASKGSSWGQYIEPFGLYNGLQWTRGHGSGRGSLHGMQRGLSTLSLQWLARAGVLEVIGGGSVKRERPFRPQCKMMMEQ